MRNQNYFSFIITSKNDWLRSLALNSQPISGKRKSSCDWLTGLFAQMYLLYFLIGFLVFLVSLVTGHSNSSGFPTTTVPFKSIYTSLKIALKNAKKNKKATTMATCSRHAITKTSSCWELFIYFL